MSENLKIGVAGLGVVGSGVFKILTEASVMLEKRCGRKITLAAVSTRSREKIQSFNLNGIQWHENPIDLALDKNIDVVVELMGGADGVALELAEKSLDSGKHFVTANKALISKHGMRLAKIAEEKKVVMAFEAAVAGGIPIIKVLKEGLAANLCSLIVGILNGTCNYILTLMAKEGLGFAEALENAQKLGYAEADPGFDIDGVDAAHKLSILSAIAFGSPVDFKSIYIEGIREISLLDINYANEMGYRIKLLGIAQLCDGIIEQRIHPCLVPQEHALARVDDVNNAVFVSGSRVGEVMLTGRGAGSFPTASSVVADICDIACGRTSYPFGVPVANLGNYKFTGVENHRGEYYLRITVRDEAGILAGISDVLHAADISVESLVQKPVKKGQNVDIVVITHICTEKAVRDAVEKIAKIKGVVDKPKLLRVES